MEEVALDWKGTLSGYVWVVGERGWRMMERRINGKHQEAVEEAVANVQSCAVKNGGYKHR